MLLLSKAKYFIVDNFNDTFVIFCCTLTLGFAFSSPAMFIFLLLELSFLSLVFTSVYLITNTLYSTLTSSVTV